MLSVITYLVNNCNDYSLTMDHADYCYRILIVNRVRLPILSYIQIAIHFLQRRVSLHELNAIPTIESFYSFGNNIEPDCCIVDLSCRFAIRDRSGGRVHVCGERFDGRSPVCHQ